MHTWQYGLNTVLFWKLYQVNGLAHSCLLEKSLSCSSYLLVNFRYAFSNSVGTYEAGATSSTVNGPAETSTSEQTLNEKGSAEESKVDMNSSDESSHVGSTAGGAQDSDKENTDAEKEAEECENSNGRVSLPHLLNPPWGNCTLI